MGIAQAWEDVCELVNIKFGESQAGKYFRVKERKSCLTTELRAGTVTFLTMAYILAVNASIISETGGPCGPQNCTGPDKSPDCVWPDINGNGDPGYEACMEQVRRSLVTATAASSCLASALMGVGANLPIAAAPGMGLNAYFLTVVGERGSGRVSYETALGAVFIEGIIFIILAVTGLRMRLIRLVPRSIMLATSAGIGLYLAFLGLQRTEGLGVMSYDPSTLVTLGGCGPKHEVHAFLVPDPAQVCQIVNGTALPTGLATASGVTFCEGGKMTNASLWLGIAGLFLISVLMSRSYKGPIILGIAFVTVVAWIPGHAASYLGASSSMPGAPGRSAHGEKRGQERMDYFRNVVALPSLAATGFKLSFKGFVTGELWIALVTFLYIDFLDTTGTLFSMASFINNYIPGFVGANKEFPRQTFAFSVDGIASIIGSLMGTSPVAAFIESAAGIREGGRTGLTALTAAWWFFVSLFFTPILSSVPPYAIGPALITVGALMMLNVVRIKWEQTAEALPAFLTIIIMPATFSIAYGIIAGLAAYIAINGTNWLLDKLGECLQWTISGSDLELPQPDQRSFSSRQPSGLVATGWEFATSCDWACFAKQCCPAEALQHSGPSPGGSGANGCTSSGRLQGPMRSGELSLPRRPSTPLPETPPVSKRLSGGGGTNGGKLPRDGADNV